MWSCDLTKNARSQRWVRIWKTYDAMFRDIRRNRKSVKGGMGTRQTNFLCAIENSLPLMQINSFFLFVCFSFPITIITISVSFHDFLFGVPFFWLNHHLLTILSSQWFSSYRPASLKNFVESCVPVSKKITKNVPQWYLGVYRQSFAFHEDRF